MCGKVLLLVVACASFVHGKLLYYKSDEDLETSKERGVDAETKTNHFVDILKRVQSKSRTLVYTRDEVLEDVIQDGLLAAAEIFKLGVEFSKEEWTAVNRVGQMMVSNSTLYTKTAEVDEIRILQDLERAANGVRNNWGIHDKMLCVKKEEENGKKDIETAVGAFKVDIWVLNFEYNSTYPEFPFLLVEEVLKSEYREKIESIEGCKNRKSVEAEIEKYTEVMTDQYNSFMSKTKTVNDVFFRHQLEVNKKYRQMKKEIEKLYLTAVENMKKCLNNRDVSHSSRNDYSNSYY